MTYDTIPLPVMAVLWLLLVFSLLSWSVIFAKMWRQWRSRRSDRAFAADFWQASDLNAGCALAQERTSPLARLCSVGAATLLELSNGTADLRHSGERKDILERTLHQQIQREQTFQESGLTLLASIGSTAPFVGLFGTVWGIMHALKTISSSGSAGLELVAGPVGESLIATAVGIATAIPAVLAYNIYLRQVRVEVSELEHFATDFLHLVLKSDRNRVR